MDMQDKLSTTWHGLWMLATVAAAVLAIVAIIAPKRVDGYYLSVGSTSTGNICVFSHWNWHSDERAYCTDRYADALDFVTKANATVAK